MNKKGFVLTETLAVTVFLVTIFTFIYIGVIPLIGTYRDMALRENDIDIIYKLYHIRKMIRADERKNILTNDNVKKITCNDLYNKTYCNNLMGNLELNNYELYFTKNIKENRTNAIFNSEIVDYLKKYANSEERALILLDKTKHTIGHLQFERFNVMGSFPSTITNNRANIREVHFINESQSNIDDRYNNASIKADITHYNYRNDGKVLAWLEDDTNNSGKYILYVGSSGTTFLSTCSSLFLEFKNLETIDFKNVDTSLVTSMHRMFAFCGKLTFIDLSNFDTEKVTNMSGMFVQCRNLTNLDVSNFNTSNVTNMSGMFNLCNSLTNLDVSNFNTSNVTDMSGMFLWCNSLTSLDVSNFNTSKVTNMSGMFSWCKSLTSLDVSNFNTSKVTNMKGMFCECNNLTILDVSNFNTSNVTDMRGMFAYCYKLAVIDVSHFDTSNVTNMGSIRVLGNSYSEFGMFEGCSSVTVLDLSHFDTSKVENIGRIFDDCKNLKTIYTSGKFVINITDANRKFEMFEGCTKIVGGNGTPYNSSYVNDEYARIDAAGTPGYFTLKTS